MMSSKRIIKLIESLHDELESLSLQHNIDEALDKFGEFEEVINDIMADFEDEDE